VISCEHPRSWLINPVSVLSAAANTLSVLPQLCVVTAFALAANGRVLLAPLALSVAVYAEPLLLVLLPSLALVAQRPQVSVGGVVAREGVRGSAPEKGQETLRAVLCAAFCLVALFGLLALSAFVMGSVARRRSPASRCALSHTIHRTQRLEFPVAHIRFCGTRRRSHAIAGHLLVLLFRVFSALPARLPRPLPRPPRRLRCAAALALFGSATVRWLGAVCHCEHVQGVSCAGRRGTGVDSCTAAFTRDASA
jgi:hypothetical protein